MFAGQLGTKPSSELETSGQTQQRMSLCDDFILCHVLRCSFPLGRPLPCSSPLNSGAATASHLAHMGFLLPSNPFLSSPGSPEHPWAAPTFPGRILSRFSHSSLGTEGKAQGASLSTQPWARTGEEPPALPSLLPPSRSLHPIPQGLVSI